MNNNNDKDETTTPKPPTLTPNNTSGMTIQEKADILYKNKEILAPMVRASTTPLRLLALKYGADLTYTEEIIDRAISKNCDRIVNKDLGTIDYCRSMSSFSKKQIKRIKGKGTGAPVILRIVPQEERGRLVYQMGTGEAGLALEAANFVCKDVDAIDINMGCPKKFSVSGGMGSALLKDVNRACDIIKTLRRNIQIPVSCKIRLLENDKQTIDFVKSLQMAGANAIAIHAREVGDEPTTRAKWSRLEPVVHSIRDQIPTIINGDLYTRHDIINVKKQSGAHSVMLARPALYNTSIFDKSLTNGELLSKTKVIQDYIEHAIKWKTNPKNVKYVINEMMCNRRNPHEFIPKLVQKFEGGQTIGKVCSCYTMDDICKLWDVNFSGGSLPAQSAFEQPTTEHRYNDDYFLAKRTNTDNSGVDNNDVKDDCISESKRVKVA